jgi:hypothetical protein
MDSTEMASRDSPAARTTTGTGSPTAGRAARFGRFWTTRATPVLLPMHGAHDRARFTDPGRASEERVPAGGGSARTLSRDQRETTVRQMRGVTGTVQAHSSRLAAVQRRAGDAETRLRRPRWTDGAGDRRLGLAVACTASDLARHVGSTRSAARRASPRLAPTV